MRLMSMKNSNETNGNRTRTLPTCSAVPQPTALPRAPPPFTSYCFKFEFILLVERAFYIPNTAFAMAILNLILRVRLASFVITLPVMRLINPV